MFLLVGAWRGIRETPLPPKTHPSPNPSPEVFPEFPGTTTTIPKEHP